MLNRLMTEEEIKEWIKRRLGAPALSVQLSNDQLTDALYEAKHWFNAKKGVEKDFTLPLYSGQVEYDVPSDLDQIIDVSFQVSPLDISLIFAPNIIADEKIPYNVFAAPSSVGLYSSFVQSLQYVDMAKRILGAENNWMYFPYKRKLLVLPNPKGTGMAFVEYKTNQIGQIEQLPERDHDLIRRYALAWAKRDLGNIFSRYSQWPAAQTMVQLNGPALLAQAEAEFKQLEDEIFNSAYPMPLITG